tara:strand:+ start:5750 stop:6067 length:318 start_codon:yes stop_codon:yes gene_type:complete
VTALVEIKQEAMMTYLAITKISAYGTRGDAKNYEFIAKPDASGKYVLNKKVQKNGGNNTNLSKNKIYVDTLTEAANLLSTNGYLINLVVSSGKRALREYKKVKIV